MSKITHDRLLSTLHYDRATGIFTWLRKPSKNMPVGMRAGNVLANGNRVISIDYRDYTASRLAWFYITAAWPSGHVGFRDRNRDNCAFDNLIEVKRNGHPAGSYDHSTPAGRSLYAKAHRETYPDAYREKYLKRDFGINLDDYRSMLVRQDGVCAICRLPELSARGGKLKHLAVDHDHVTGTIRGLLCSNCNPMIGYAKDDPARLRAAADYLDRRSDEHANIVLFRKDAS